jgi:hypothetical protein
MRCLWQSARRYNVSLKPVRFPDVDLFRHNARISGTRHSVNVVRLLSLGFGINLVAVKIIKDGRVGGDHMRGRKEIEGFQEQKDFSSL